MKKLLGKLLVVALMISLMVPVFSPVVAHAATTNPPYGFTYDDSASGKTMYKFYVYSTSEQAYVPKSTFFSTNARFMYHSKGTLISSQLVGSGARYAGFDNEGNFYFIAKLDSENVLYKVSPTFKTTLVLNSGAISLAYNADDLAVAINTTSGKKNIKTLVPVGPVDPGDDDDDDQPTPPAPTKAKNRVDTHENSAGELVYDAFKNSKLYTRITTSKDGKKVVNETAHVRLSDTLKGAKFLGYDSKYNVYLYESNGTLYRFKQGSWYSAEKLSLNGTYKKFEKDTNGFITKIVTSKATYTINQLTDSSKWKAKKTYVVKKSGYMTLYVKGSSKSYTLSLSGKKLSFNGKSIATGVSKYGFTTSKKIVYLKGSTVYLASLKAPKTAKAFCTKAKALKYNSVNLVDKVTLKSGKTKAVK